MEYETVFSVIHIKQKHRPKQMMNIDSGRCGDITRTLLPLEITADDCNSVYILFRSFYSAAALLAMQSAVIATAIPSVHPSHAGTLSRRMKIGSCGIHCEVAKTLVFLFKQ